MSLLTLSTFSHHWKGHCHLCPFSPSSHRIWDSFCVTAITLQSSVTIKKLSHPIPVAIAIMKLAQFYILLLTILHGKTLLFVKSQLARNSQEILNDIVNYGLDRTRYLVDVLERKIYENGLNLQKSDPAHFLGVFNKQTDKSKNLSRYGYATLEASTLLTRQ